MKHQVMAAVIMLAMIAGCDNGEAEKARQLQDRVAQLDGEVSRLKAELDEERNGADRMLSLSKAKIQSDSLDEARGSLDALIKRHPGKPEAIEAEALLAQVDAKIAAKTEAGRVAQKKKDDEAKAALAKLDKNLLKKTDEFNGITWISHRTEPALRKKMALYFGAKDNSAAGYPLRLKFLYYSDEWLFVQRVTIKADDQTFDLGRIEFERDHTGGSIWEWSDEQLTNFKMLDAVLSAKKVMIRFDGRQYYSDFTLPDSQKTAMREVLMAWERYGGVRR